MDHLLEKLERLDVAIIDDSRSMRELYKTVLRDLRVGRVRTYAEAPLALAELQMAPADVVIVDWMMEPMDGLEFTRALRALPDSLARRIPVLMVTAHSEAWRVEAARDAGVTEFLAKPVSVRLVAERLLMIVEKPRPFVREATYAGPDRRRRDAPFHGVDRRANVMDKLLGQQGIAELLGGDRRG
jgi:CheY-like chemotaxis protein